MAERTVERLSSHEAVFYLCPGGINMFTSKNEPGHPIEIFVPKGKTPHQINYCIEHGVQVTLVKPENLVIEIKEIN